MQQLNELSPIEPPLIHQGRTYSGHYRLEKKGVRIFQRLATKWATHHEDPPALFATQLLYELVVLEGRGVPDPEANMTD